MRYKRFMILTLTALNLLLLSALLIMSYDLPAAFAQGRGGADRYVAVTGEYTAGTDALYLLHAGKGQLTALVPEQDQSGRIFLVDMLDVAADMGR